MKSKRFKMPGDRWKTYRDHKRGVSIETSNGRQYARVYKDAGSWVLFTCGNMTRAEAIAFLEKALEKVMAAK